MKKVLFGLTALSFLVAPAAKADFVQGRQRVVQRTVYLDRVDEKGNVLKANDGKLEAIKEDGKRDFVAFNITREIVIVPIHAPAKHITLSTRYNVTSVERLGAGMVKYRAVEDVNVPINALSFVRKHIIVTEDEIHHSVQIVEIANDMVPSIVYEGEYEDLAVTQ